MHDLKPEPKETAEPSARRKETAAEPQGFAQSVLSLQRRHGNRYVQRMATDLRNGGGLEPDVESGIQRARGGGSALDGPVRGRMESAFGADFSGVRIHTGSEADYLNRSVSARAFTTGQDIFFRQGEYNPGTSGGRELLAHELTHVVQQNGAPVQAKLTLGPVDDPAEREADETARQVVRRETAAVQRSSGGLIQRDACPARPSGESAQSRTPDGVLASNTAFSTSGGTSNLDIVDFAVNSSALPPGVTSSSDWQRGMSLILGDPSMRVAVSAFTDCVGADQENLSLRRSRRDSVMNVMPAAVRSKVLFSFVITATDFLDTNTTAEGRARNRSVRVTFTSTDQEGACDRITRAANFDEYLFLVRCMENRLGLSAPGDVRTALSVLRQIYYGNAAWSSSRNRVWNDVIPTRPWDPNNNPESALHAPLMAALRASQVVEGTDVGHLLTGIEAMLDPRDVAVSLGPAQFQTSLVNEEWATWAGDVGSAAAEWSLDAWATGTPGDAGVFFSRFASDADLRGNVAAFAFRSGANGGAPPQQLRQALRLTGPLSEALLQYFRLTSTPLGNARGSAVRSFIQAYGGQLNGNALTNRPALVNRLRPSVEEFAGLFVMERILRGAQGGPGAPPLQTYLVPAIQAMTERYVDWLLGHL